MDREIPTRVRLSAGVASALLFSTISTLVLTTQNSAQDRGFGRRGGGGFQMPSSEEMFSRLDANNDGSLSQTEINNSFMSRAFRDRDLSGGLSREQFSEEMQRMRERVGRGGRGGPGGDGDRRRDDERRDDDRSRDGESSGEQGSPEGGTPAATPGTTATPANTPMLRTRVTLDLQAELVAGDTDRDGQIGLYEWRRFAGRSLREFHQLDLNKDGFVTPREFATVRPESTPVATPAATAAAPPAGTATPAGESTPAASTTDAGSSNQGSPPAGNSPAAKPVDERTARDAERFFRLLDTNRDGQIAPSEWMDGRIRTMFTNGGIDLSQPLLADDFSRHYARLSTNE